MESADLIATNSIHMLRYPLESNRADDSTALLLRLSMVFLASQLAWPVTESPASGEGP